MKNPEAISIAVNLWNCLQAGRWDDARQLLGEDFEAIWPQNREIVTGPDKFIRLNREYPGSYKIEITNTLHHLDKWDWIDHVVTVTFIEPKYIGAPLAGKVPSLYAISFFEIEEEKIVKMQEYWAETFPAPEWRKHLVENY